MITNVSLMALAGALIFYYVLSANGLATSNYSVSSLRQELNQAIQHQSVLTQATSQTENDEIVAQFARSMNMVLAGENTYMFENGGVALVR